MTKENTEYLAGMRDKMGLSKEQAEKIIKGVQNQRLQGGLEAAKNTGTLTLQKVLDMKESGVDVDSFLSEELRLSLYAKEVRSIWRTYISCHAQTCHCNNVGLYTMPWCSTLRLQHAFNIRMQLMWLWVLLQLPMVNHDKLPVVLQRDHPIASCTYVHLSMCARSVITHTYSAFSNHINSCMTMST